RGAGLLFVAQIRDRLLNPPGAPAAKQSRYACKIKETTNGSGSGARSQTWQALEVISAWCIERHVQIDEPERTAQNGQDQAQEVAHSKTETQITKASYSGRSCSGWKTPER